MENHTRLRVKVGVHEFEAEGPTEQVAAQYEAWRQLVDDSSKMAAPAASDAPNPAVLPASAVTEVKTREGYAAPWDIFWNDPGTDVMSLRVHPPASEMRDADAILLLLYGYRRSGKDGEGLVEVPVTRLKESIQVSGLRVMRIDRAAKPYVTAGYILKSGRGKGGVYRLTVTGYSKAQEMAHALFAQLV